MTLYSTAVVRTVDWARNMITEGEYVLTRKKTVVVRFETEYCAADTTLFWGGGCRLESSGSGQGWWGSVNTVIKRPVQ